MEITIPFLKFVSRPYRDGMKTYTDKYGRVRQVDIDVEVFGEESAPVLVVGWPDDGLQLFILVILHQVMRS